MARTGTGNTIRTHFLLKLFGGMLLFWGIVWHLHFLVYGERLMPSNYVWLSLLIPFASLLDLITRRRKRRHLGGLSRSAISAITQREILFLLVVIFGVMVMGRETRISRFFLGLFVLAYSMWIAWMNHVGHRLHHRLHLRSLARKRNRELNG